jgi:phospholipid-translocating ATPase
MIFRQCSIGSVVYNGNDKKEETVDLDEKQALLNSVTALAENQASGSSNSAARSSRDTAVHQFYDRDLEHDLEAALSEDPDRRHARNLNGFFSVLSLCHTVLTARDPETGRIMYKAQSPDEAALVQAAADVGFQFLGRERDILSLRTPSSEDVEKYELLNILEFTSARKRMSVILRRIDGDDHRLFLLTKGADNVIFERLKAGADQDVREETEKHLSQFANEGLRTLTLGYKIINGMHYSFRYPSFLSAH